MERYIYKYSDVVFAAEVEKIIEMHNSKKSIYNTQTVDLLNAMYDLTESYIRNESARLLQLFDKLMSKVPEFKDLGLLEVEEKEVIKNSEIVLEKLRAKINDMRNGEALYLTLH
ncbi:MAG: hypothetical protein QW085_02180 [Pyrobaculum sp.]